MRKKLTRYVFAACCWFAGSAHCQAGVVTFGSGANQFNMEFVTIGNPGNAPDTTGAPNPAGAVGYVYGIGKFEVSEDMITKYNANFGTANSRVITKDTRGTNKPATSVSWNEAARFVNWLNTSTGGFAAYKFTTGGVNDNISLWTASDTLDYDASNPYRSKRATYVLPSHNEWHKAAYYNPSNGTYYDFANGLNTAPTAVASGIVNNTAVYGQSFVQGPANVNQAGGLSPYGVMGLGGNVAEWDESSFDTANSSGSSTRGYRGGSWRTTNSYFLSAASRSEVAPSFENFIGLGFRVASLTSTGIGGGNDNGGDGGTGGSGDGGGSNNDGGGSNNDGGGSNNDGGGSNNDGGGSNNDGGGGTGGEVPEPTSMAIFALGSLGIALRSRFRK